MMLKRILILLALGINLALLPGKGTGDVVNWQNLTDKIISTPINQLFPKCLNYDCGVFYPATYPPGHFLVTFLFAKILPVKLFGSLLVVKLSIFFFYLLTLLTIIYFVRSVSVKTKKLTFEKSAFFFLTLVSLIINSQGLGYTDFFTVPPLILSLIFLFRGNFIPAGLFYSTSFLIKWQPLIILPLIAAFIILSNKSYLHNLINFTIGLLLPIIFLLPLNKYIFSSLSFSFFKGALADPFLSSALNLPYILGIFYHLLFPNIFGSLKNNAFPFISGASKSFQSLLLLPKISFLLIYLLILVKYKKNRKKITNKYLYFLNSAVVTLVIYFFVSSVVHENHLFLAVIFQFLLFILNPTKINRRILFTLDIVNLTNLFAFFGFTGSIIYPPELSVAFTLTVAVFLSLVIFPAFLSRYFNNEAYLQATAITEEPKGRKK